MPIKNQVQLITYPDSLGGSLSALNSVLTGALAEVFQGGVHILPPFPSSGDRGFAPLRYDQIDPKFGGWADIQRLGQTHDIVVDLMVNHISRQSHFFQDFLAHGRRSPYADLFIPLDKIWADGNPPQADIHKIFLRKPDHPFSTVRIAESGAEERIWTTFGKRDWSEQIDLDVHSSATRRLFTQYLENFSRQGIKMVRLDAIGYVIKKPGTSCFMVEPEIYDFLAWIGTLAQSFGLEILPEVHDIFPTQQKLAQHGYRVYNFVLPALILHTLLSRSGEKLKQHLRGCPRQQVTMLDCHDGIPILPDVSGILKIDECQRVVAACERQGARFSRIFSAQHKAAQQFDVHQINCTYFSALDHDDDAYIAARAVQFFAPGVPQVYYVGLLGGKNDFAEAERTGENRAINRHNYTMEEIEANLQRPVVQRLLRLIALRNQHPAFNGILSILESGDQMLHLAWRNGAFACALELDLATFTTTLRETDQHGAVRAWSA